MADTTLRVGLVGATPGRGWGYRAHIPAYQALSDVELAAVCTAHPETAEQAAKEYGVSEYYHDYHDLVQSPNIDAVSVVTRVLLHYEISKAALEAGKHVYSEWPLTVTSEQAQELSDLANAKGLRNMVGLQARFSPPLLHMKELLAEGYVGRVMTFTLTMLGAGAFAPRSSAAAFQGRRESGAGTLSVSMGHSVDGFTWLLGDLAEVSGLVAPQINEWKLQDTGETVSVTTPDNVAVAARLHSGGMGVLQASNTAHGGPGFRLEVYGSEGKLAATSPGLLELSKITLTGAHAGESEHELETPDRHTWVSGYGQEHSAFNIAQLFSRFAGAVREGRDISPNFGDAAKVHRMLEAMVRSSETGQRVTVE